MNSMLRGVFLTSEKPERTATFYREIAGLPLEQVGTPATYMYWKYDKDGMPLAIHDAEKFAESACPARLDSNVTHLYFKIDAQDQFLEHVKQLGITPYSTDDIVVTMVDPDGRKVMFGTA